LGVIYKVKVAQNMYLSGVSSCIKHCQLGYALGFIH